MDVLAHMRALISGTSIRDIDVNELTLLATASFWNFRAICADGCCLMRADVVSCGQLDLLQSREEGNKITCKEIAVALATFLRLNSGKCGRRLISDRLVVNPRLTFVELMV